MGNNESSSNDEEDAQISDFVNKVIKKVGKEIINENELRERIKKYSSEVEDMDELDVQDQLTERRKNVDKIKNEKAY